MQENASKPTPPVSLALPACQKWSCHSCSNCCRDHAVAVTEEERQQILSQGWSGKDCTPSGEALFARQARRRGMQSYRLAHGANGACVFLNKKNLCRIHAKFGEAAKPRACQVYPFGFHPAGGKITVSLRFSCPSVAANRGLPLEKQAGQFQRLARMVVPPDHGQLQAPPLAGSLRADWPEFLQFMAALDGFFAPANLPITLKLQRALFWLQLVRLRYRPEDTKPLGEFLAFLLDATRTTLPDDIGPTLPCEPPSTSTMMLFRQLTARYARKDTVADLSMPLSARWKLLRAGMRFARGKGMVPALQPQFREVPFDALEQPFGMPPECEELWTRYFRVKVQGLHFCGLAFYSLPAVEGFQDLALVFPATMWIARWLAASDGRSRLSPEDVQQALSLADHQFGYSPLLGSANFRRQTRMLSKSGEIPKLIRWYAR